MRRSIAISLLMLFSFALIAPMLAPDAEANLPACCRRNGKHHCAMSMMGQLGANEKGFTSVSEKCSSFPASTCAVHSPSFKPEASEQFFAQIVSHPACVAQTEALSRIAFLRSHQKRGPPSLLA